MDYGREQLMYQFEPVAMPSSLGSRHPRGGSSSDDVPSRLFGDRLRPSGRDT